QPLADRMLDQGMERPRRRHVVGTGSPPIGASPAGQERPGGESEKQEGQAPETERAKQQQISPSAGRRTRVMLHAEPGKCNTKFTPQARNSFGNRKMRLTTHSDNCKIFRAFEVTAPRSFSSISRPRCAATPRI